MIWFLLATHALCCLGLVAARPTTAARHHGVFALATVPALVTAAWAVTRLGDRAPATASFTWVEGLDLEVAFAVGPLAALMTVIVSGIGVLVFVYASGYFAVGSAGVTRMAATLLAFSGAMIGLVWADSVWTLFVFWELTSITSFLLVGYKTADPVAALAARRALLITMAGGLVLLAGFVLLADATGTTRLSEMTATSGTRATVAAVLVLVAAATKSAQVPFHVWLPGAMAAPTPVSAYLHSATMVKAGVLLVALFAPVLEATEVWKPLALALGVASMLWGGVAALRHNDAKAILAWGTVSQLGFMITLLALGTGKATFAAIAIITAHAVFKAALFMVVGEVDVRTGTRDISELSGLWRSMPVAAVVAVVSGASMAGVPPMLGFPAKEAAVEAALGLEGAEAAVVGSAIVLGAVLTAAYTARLLIGLFAGRAPATRRVARRRPAMATPAAALAAATVGGFVVLGTVTDAVRPAAAGVQPAADAYELIRWPGPGSSALWISLAAVVAGTALGTFLGAAARTPQPIGADIADRTVDDVIRVARRLTARLQHGSLPVYLATMTATVALAASPLVLTLDTSAVHRWDNPMQAVLVAFVALSALASTQLSSRLGAALGLGAVGLGVSGLFVTHGAPDLAITQLLVETVVVVAFVIALGHLRRRFPPVGHTWRNVRIVVAAAAGLAVSLALVTMASGATTQPPIDELVTEAVDTGGGNNVVNVILTDVRGLDTLGEVVVLTVTAVGILALARPRRRPVAVVASTDEVPS